MLYGYSVIILEIKKIKDLKIGIGIEKKQQNKAKDNVTNTFNHIFVLYPEHTSTDLLSHAYYRDPYLTLHMGNSVQHISSFMNKVCIT